MKDTQHINIFVIFDQIGNPVMPIQKYADLSLGYCCVCITQLGKTLQRLYLGVNFKNNFRSRNCIIPGDIIMDLL